MKRKRFIILIICLGLIFIGAVSPKVKAQDETVLTSEQKSRCAKFYQWFTIEQKDGKKTNAVEDLPQFCSVQQVVVWVINALLAVAGSVALIFITIGGFQYVTSAGNEESAEKAKKTLVTSVIGLVVIILAATIVRVIAGTLSLGK